MSSRNRSMKAFILRTAFIFSALGFFIIYYAATNAYNGAVKSNAVAVSNLLAQSTFNSMFQVMRQGWSRAQLEEFITNLESSNEASHYQIQIYRGTLVDDKFGAIDAPAGDGFISQTYTSQRAQHLEASGTLRYSYPLKARQECLGCHTNAATGDVLGVIEVQQQLEPLMINAQGGLLKSLLYLAPFPFILALIVIFFMNRRIDGSIRHLEENIDKVNKVSDLTDLELHSTDLGFSELNRVFAKMEGLTLRMKEVAVDRELLEFEIRLLEKFVITSEIVRDWREYVSILLADINTVMNAYNLFSIFKVDDELFALEIFWAGPPAPETRELMEKEIRKKLQTHPVFAGVMYLEINHNIADRQAPVVSLHPEDIKLQTKSLLLKAPKIGGIVGIGVHSDIALEETRRLVMESILSTLLNVVGSVKAIYKYTKDLEYYATRDPLTDLHNQRIFWELLNYEILRAERHDYKFSLLVVDLDNFKSLNDANGHAFGDRCLQEVSKAMRAGLRAGDMLSRYGGDEFTIILPETDIEQAAEVARRVIDSVHALELKTPDGDDLDIHLSVGVAVYPDHAQSSKDLFMFADNMMYKAKNLGKNRIYLPSDEDVVEVFRDISEKSLLIGKAIKEKRVIPYFQPLMATASGEIKAVEVLSRIQLEDENVMGAHEFIEIAENMGVIHNLDYAVMEKAFEQVREEGFEGLIFINMSPKSLVLSEFIPEVKRIVEEAQMPRERVVFEITERDTVKNMTMLEKFVSTLKAEGFKLAIDDFGSGFSSFHYLKHFPIDYVKIEGEFIANMVIDDKDNAVVRCIANLAHELKAETIAEFVESDEVLKAVTTIGITYAQGYHIRRPAPYIFAPETPCQTALAEHS